MPKIKITERDTTGTIEESVSHVVYIPGKSDTSVDPKLCEKVSELEAMAIDKTCLSFRLAKYLINLGMKVLYEGVVESSGGGLGNIDWDRLKDKSLYDIRFLTTGGYGVISANMVECARTRGDCTALLDHAKTVSPAPGMTQVKTIRNLFASIDPTPLPSGQVEKGHFAAAFTPWFKTKEKNLMPENPASGVTTEDIPASFGYLFAYARSIKKQGEWYAIAGSARGIIPELDSVNYTYSSAEVEILQARAATGEVELDDKLDNVGYAINPIAYVRPFGFILWGNRTLKVNTGTTALSFLNVRNLVSTIKKELYEAARKYTFEQNGEVLWSNFQSQIIPTLDKMQTGNGILGYRFERLATTAKARIKAKLTIIPVEAVEDFELEVLLSDALDITE